MSDTRSLRKLLLNALRHDPDQLGLTLDPCGSVDLAEVLYGFNTFTPYHIDTESLAEITRGSSVFELQKGTIRAKIGHTTEQVTYPIGSPPTYLYYLVPEKEVSYIETEGLRARQTRYLPLERDKEEALATERRRRMKKPVVALKVLAEEAYLSGVLFYQYYTQWYVEEVGSPFLERI